MLWPDAERKLIKSGRKWFASPKAYRSATLYCECCGVELGEFDLYYHSLETNMFCSKCVSAYKRQTPFSLCEGVIVTADYGSSVKIKYEDSYYAELSVFKECHFNKKGRYIKVKNRRHYLNLMSIPKQSVADNGGKDNDN